MRHRTKLLKIAAILTFLPCGLAQPSAGPEEVHVSSRPYLPFQLRTETTSVQVAVVVRDGKGHAVSGLQKDDFRLIDQGKDRAISNFSIDSREGTGGVGAATAKGRETPDMPSHEPPAAPHPPRFIALFFDDIGTTAGDLARMKRDAARFVADGMSPGDRLAVVANSAGRISNFLTDKQQIADAIARVEAHPRFSPGGTSVCPRITPYDAYLIANYLSEQAVQAKQAELAACSGATGTGGRPGITVNVAPPPRQLSPSRNVIQQLAEEMWTQVRIASQSTTDALTATLADLSAQKGTRVLLLVSSGFLTGTMEEEEDSLTDRAVRAGVVINAMDAKGLYVEPAARPFGDGAQVNLPVQVSVYENMVQNAASETATAIMADLAQATGGLFFHHNNDFTFGFRELGAVPEVTYLLAFHPDDTALDGKYHKLKIRLAASNSYTIEARPGYFATPRPAPIEEKGRAELDRQVTRSEILQQFPAAIQMQYGTKTAAGATPVQIQMHVDVKALTFGQINGRHIQKLTFVFALLDEKDAIVSAREGQMEFALTDEKYQNLQQTGVNAVLSLAAPTGKYRLRAVAMEGARGQMAAQAYIVQVP